MIQLQIDELRTEVNRIVDEVTGVDSEAVAAQIEQVLNTCDDEGSEPDGNENNVTPGSANLDSVSESDGDLNKRGDQTATEAEVRQETDVIVEDQGVVNEDGDDVEVSGSLGEEDSSPPSGAQVTTEIIDEEDDNDQEEENEADRIRRRRVEFLERQSRNER